MSEPPPCTCRVHEPFGDEATWDENDRNLMSDVQDAGWSVCIIGDGDPPWAYSVGMWHTLRRPDVVIFGLRPPDMGKWINLTGELTRIGRRFPLDQKSHGILNGFPVEFRLADQSWYKDLFGYGMWFYKGWFPVAQMVWPDRNGVFPWEPGCGESCRTRQPQLWAPQP
jgi:hypothetical protein